MGVAVDLISGTLSGCCASLVGQPLDTVRVRAQVTGFGPGAVASHLWRTEGVAGFYRGALPPLLGMGPKNAVVFAAKGFAHRSIEGHLGSPGDLPLRYVALSGCFAGLLQSAVITPADRLKVQFQVLRQTRGCSAASHFSLTETIHLARGLAARQGWFRALFSGGGITLLRTVPGCAVYFSTYEAVKRSLRKPVPDADLRFDATTPLVAGAAAGVASCTLTYPLDVLKSCVQGQDPSTTARWSIWNLARELHRASGPNWIFRGYIPTVTRAALINAVNFFVYTSCVDCLID